MPRRPARRRSSPVPLPHSPPARSNAPGVVALAVGVFLGAGGIVVALRSGSGPPELVDAVGGELEFEPGIPSDEKLDEMVRMWVDNRVRAFIDPIDGSTDDAGLIERSREGFEAELKPRAEKLRRIFSTSPPTSSARSPAPSSAVTRSASGFSGA